jgi:hypothetical protein
VDDAGWNLQLATGPVIFDRTVSVDQVPDGYRAMAGRDALKVLIRI